MEEQKQMKGSLSNKFIHHLHSMSTGTVFTRTSLLSKFAGKITGGSRGTRVITIDNYRRTLSVAGYVDGDGCGNYKIAKAVPLKPMSFFKKKQLANYKKIRDKEYNDTVRIWGERANY
jgi:hypothetical protein